LNGHTQFLVGLFTMHVKYEIDLRTRTSN
jgi:hypothetical protein